MSTSRRSSSTRRMGTACWYARWDILWDDNDERGVYKTTDGGKTWNKVLAGANGSTGCA